jgi:thiamine-monophosphate kinase
VITGVTGESAAGLEILLSGAQLPEEVSKPLIQVHLSPRAHVREGRILAGCGRCHAAIDVSDGLSSDLAHICEQSKVGAVVYEERLPVSDRLTAAAGLLKKDPMEWLLHGGEDYILLAALDPEYYAQVENEIRLGGGTLHKMGEFVEGTDVELVRKAGGRERLTAKGWDHFR